MEGIYSSQNVCSRRQQVQLYHFQAKAAFRAFRRHRFYGDDPQQGLYQRSQTPAAETHLLWDPIPQRKDRGLGNSNI